MYAIRSYYVEPAYPAEAEELFELQVDLPLFVLIVHTHYFQSLEQIKSLREHAHCALEVPTEEAARRLGRFVANPPHDPGGLDEAVAHVTGVGPGDGCVDFRQALQFPQGADPVRVGDKLLPGGRGSYNFV